ncbi:MAG: lipase family alpha/beta hydrolase [Anaerolineales bacterium]
MNLHSLTRPSSIAAALAIMVGMATVVARAASVPSPANQPSATAWTVYETLFGPPDVSHLEGDPTSVTDADFSTSYAVVQDAPAVVPAGPSIMVKIRPLAGHGNLRPVTAIRVTIHMGAPLTISLTNDAYLGISGGPRPTHLIAQWIFSAATCNGCVLDNGQVYSWAADEPVLMDEISVSFSARKGFGALLANPIGFLEVEVIEASAPPIQVEWSAEALTLNADGWYAENPAALQVTLSCPAVGEICDQQFGLDLVADAATRFYVDDPAPAGAEVTCNSLLPGGTEYSFTHWFVGCKSSPDLFYYTLTLDPGETLLMTWAVWIQPSDAGEITAAAAWGPDTAEDAVQVPLASIQPVMLLPGILGTMPPSYDQTAFLDPFFGIYHPLIVNLQKMGYELYHAHEPGQASSLFLFPYDWRESNMRSAAELSLRIPEVLANAAGLAYVGDPETGGPATKVDLVVHSMGGLVTRAYVQNFGYKDDVRKVIFIATPHLGFPATYRTWEYLTWNMYFDESKLEQALLGGLMDYPLWPTWIAKKYGATHEEIEAMDCGSPADYIFDHESCPTAYEWSHDPRGIGSLPEMLPVWTAGAEPYLHCGAEACRDLPDFPYGREINPLLEGPGQLTDTIQLLAERLGLVNLYAIYGDSVSTEVGYRVGPPSDLFWAHGKPVEIQTENSGDNLIPAYSMNLRGLLPGIPADNVVALHDTDDTANHKQIMYHPSVQRTLVPTFLTGVSVPFHTGHAGGDFPGGTWIVVTLFCPLNVTLTDPAGNRVGYDPSTDGVLTEIPGAIYAAPNVEGQFILAPESAAGEYQLTVQAFGSGEYTVNVHAVEGDSMTLLATFTGTVETDDTLEFVFESGAPSTIFEDQFDRPDSSDLGVDWEETSGDWSIVAGQLTVPGGRTPWPCFGRPCPTLDQNESAAGDGATAWPQAWPIPLWLPRWNRVLTTASYSASDFVLETRFRTVRQPGSSTQGAGSARPIIGLALAQTQLLFGVAEDGTGGYRVIYDALRGQLRLLGPSGKPLASASVAAGVGEWRTLRVVRHSDGGLEASLDTGDGYPDNPQLRVNDLSHPALGRVGFALVSSGYDLYVDWVSGAPLD